MINVLKCEVKRCLRSVVFWVALALAVFMFMPLTLFNVIREARTVAVFEGFDIAKHNAQIAEIANSGVYVLYKDGKLAVDYAAKKRFEAGGELEKGYGWLFSGEYHLEQLVDEEFYPESEANVYEKHNFKRFVTQFTSSIIVGIAFSAYFFGRDFIQRGYSAKLMAGRTRREIFSGKFAVYYSLSALISLASFAIGFIFFLPRAFELGAGYVIRCLLTRFIADLGLFSLFAVLPFALRGMALAMTAGAVFYSLFISADAIIVIPLNAAFANPVLWGNAFSFGAFLIAAAVSALMIAASFVASLFIFNKMGLK